MSERKPGSSEEPGEEETGKRSKSQFGKKNKKWGKKFLSESNQRIKRPRGRPGTSRGDSDDSTKNDKSVEIHSPSPSRTTVQILEDRYATRSTQSELVPGSEFDQVEFVPYAQWHLRMQKQYGMHLGEENPFSRWKCCKVICHPFSKLEARDYNGRMCNILCKFRTFKSVATKVFLCIILYVILLELLGSTMYPGEIHFTLALMFLVSYIIGKLSYIVGLPVTVTQLLVGIAFGNLPIDDPPSYTSETTRKVMDISETLYLMLMLIRAAILLDLTKTRSHATYIVKFAVVPLAAEFVVVLFSGYFLLKLPWQWSALEGSILAPVSLASVVSVLEKSDKYKICAPETTNILIAASSVEIVLSLYSYSICLSLIFSKGLLWGPSTVALIMAVLLQFVAGLIIGTLLGCFLGAFPDRRSALAPYFRIILIGLTTLVLLMLFHFVGVTGMGVLAALTMGFVASNIWVEMGWKEETNPVRYFYNLMYNYIQPIAVSLIGFTVRFNEIDPIACAQSLGVIVLGLIARELTVYTLTYDKSYPTTLKEKVFICLCWSAKGSAEALLASVLSSLVSEYYEFVSDDSHTLEELKEFAKKISYTSIIAVLVTAPVTTLLTTFIAPRLQHS